MTRQKIHKAYCFAGYPAPCTGFFADDVLPCVCGASGNLVDALSQFAFPAVPIDLEIPAEVHILQLSA